jgi:hypothetical protein
LAIVVKRETDLMKKVHEHGIEIQSISNDLEETKQKALPIYLVGISTAIILGIYTKSLIVTVVFLFLAWVVLWKNHMDPFKWLMKQKRKEAQPILKGNDGEVIVSMEVEHRLSQDYYLFNDLVLPYQGKTTQIDHVIIGPSCIICIETKNWTGKFYPDKNGWRWFPIDGYANTNKVNYSPQKQSKYHSIVLSKLLKENRINVFVKPIVVLTNNYCQWMGAWEESCPVLRVADLPGYIKGLTNRGKVFPIDMQLKTIDVLLANDQKS